MRKARDVERSQCGQNIRDAFEMMGFRKEMIQGPA